MDTRRKIMSSAVNLFARNGYHSTTMEMIAEEAGLGKGTLYWHFASKEDLYRGIIQAGLQEYSSFVENLQGKELTYEEKIRAIIKFKIRFYLRHKPLASVIMANLDELGADFKKRMWQEQRKNNQTLANIFLQGKEEGVFKIEDPLLTARAFNGMVDSVLFSPDLNQVNGKVLSGVLENLIFRGILKT